MATGGSTKTVLTALFANAGISVAKFVGFVITGSTSMLTESVHSLADTSNQALLLLGGRQAKKAESREHPFGYGRERYFWSFVVALILFSLGGLFAIYEGWEKVQHPHELDSPAVAIVILLFAMVLEGFAFNTARKEAEHVKGNLSWPRFIRRSRNPELPVVLLEDSGAMLGLFIAFIGVLASMFIDPVFDGYATLAIGLLLLAIAVVLAIEMKSLIIGESAVPEDRDRVIAAIEGHRDVSSLIHMRTQHIGPDELLVGAKVHFRDSLDSAGLVRAINETETSIRSAVPIARVIYIEPDLTGSPSVTMGTMSFADQDHKDDGQGHAATDDHNASDSGDHDTGDGSEASALGVPDKSLDADRAKAMPTSANTPDDRTALEDTADDDTALEDTADEDAADDDSAESEVDQKAPGKGDPKTSNDDSTGQANQSSSAASASDDDNPSNNRASTKKSGNSTAAKDSDDNKADDNKSAGNKADDKSAGNKADSNNSARNKSDSNNSAGKKADDKSAGNKSDDSELTQGIDSETESAGLAWSDALDDSADDSWAKNAGLDDEIGDTPPKS